MAVAGLRPTIAEIVRISRFDLVIPVYPSTQVALEAKADALPGIYAQISSPNSYFLGEYTAVDGAKVAALPEAQQAEIQATVKEAKQGALADVTVFPLIMLVGYIGMFLYFRGRGGYKAVELTGAQAAGGVAGAAEM